MVSISVYNDIDKAMNASSNIFRHFISYVLFLSCSSNGKCFKKCSGDNCNLTL